jgi:hypothetical protein
MNVQSKSFVLNEPAEFSVDTEFGSEKFHVDIQGNREGPDWNVKVILTGSKIQAGRQEVVLRINHFSEPVVIGLIDPDYQRARTKLVNLAEFIQAPFSEALSVKKLGEQLLCTLKLNNGKLSFKLEQGISGNLHKLVV